MNVRTKVTSMHLARLSLIAFMTLGFCLYCVYDGMVGYPNQRIRANEFIQFTEDNKALDPKDIADKWNEYAKEKGWPTGNPGEPKTDGDIVGQFVMAVVIGIISFIFLVQLLRWRGRWIECIGDTLTSNRGHEFDIEHITELDKKKWDKKGIAKISYEKDGKSGHLHLDDCYYERDTTQQILRHIEANIDHSILVNGKPEPPPKETEESATEEESAS